MRPRRCPVYVLAGYYWTENVGDMALRQAALDLLEGRLPADVWAGHLGDWMHRGVGPDWGDVEAVLLPGGGLFHDLGGWDPGGWGTASTATIFWASVITEAAARGVPVVAWANGFGPFRSTDALGLARTAYGLTTYRSWRDPASARLAQAGGVVTADLALTCGVTLRPDEAGPIAIVLRRFPGWDRADDLVDAVAEVVRRTGRQALVIPFETDDVDYVGEADIPGRVELLTGTSWRERTTALSGCSAVITNRFHAALWGFASGAPVLALPTDDPKLRSAADMFSSDVRVDRAQAVRPDDLWAAWERAVADVARDGVAERRRSRAAELADLVRQEVPAVVEALGGRPRPLDPLARVLLTSVQARNDDLARVRTALQVTVSAARSEAAAASQRAERAEQSEHEALVRLDEAARLGAELERAQADRERAQAARERARAERERARHLRDTNALRAEVDDLASRAAALESALAVALDRAEDVSRQLQEVLSSTSWRAAAPVRVVGSAKRRAQVLLPYVNRRRLGAVARLLRTGDLRTLRQRLAATEAVAVSLSAMFDQARRPVVHAVADPWPLDQPLVTVVIPCFNYGQYVDEAIASVLAQTLGDRVEVVVVDGGSTDPATVAHLAELAESPAERVRVLLRSDGRHLVGDNRNYGIAAARGKYVCCLDADDVLDPRYLEVAAFLAERYAYGIVSTATRCFGTVTDTFGLLPEPDLADMLLANNVTTVAVFAKQDWARAGGFQDTGLGWQHVHEDWRLWVRLSALGARITNITGVELFRYRVHSSASLSRQEGVPAMRDQRAAVRELNADVVDDEAIAASARARAVEIVRGGAHDNLLPASPDGRPGVLLCLPFLQVGGAEKLLSAVVAHLAKVGFRVVVVTTLLADPAHGDTSAWFEAHTCEVFHLPRLLAPHRWDDFVDHLVQSKGIELVWIAGSTWAYESLARLRATHARIKVVDLLFNTVGHTASNRQHASLIDVTLVENTEVEQWLLGRGESPDRVVRAVSGVDLDTYRPNGRRRAAGVLRIGYSGRFSEEKDPLAFMSIAAATAAREDLEFVMTGAGPLEPQVRQRLLRPELRGRVTMLGMVDDVRAHLASLDVLVLPSRLDGRPMVVLEALAMGIPVVASSVGALPELVVDGVTGFLCSPGDTADFANALLRLADEPELLDRMGVAARASAEAHLDARGMLLKYEETFRSVLDH